MRYSDRLESGCHEEIAHLKERAFMANRRAKASKNESREGFYQIKASAINALLKNGSAFVDGVDWSTADPTIGVTFTGGGRLHTKLSALDLLAFRSVRLQLTSEDVTLDWYQSDSVSRGCYGS